MSEVVDYQRQRIEALMNEKAKLEAENQKLRTRLENAHKLLTDFLKEASEIEVNE